MTSMCWESRLYHRHAEPYVVCAPFNVMTTPQSRGSSCVFSKQFCGVFLLPIGCAESSGKGLAEECLCPSTPAEAPCLCFPAFIIIRNTDSLQLACAARQMMHPFPEGFLTNLQHVTREGAKFRVPGCRRTQVWYASGPGVKASHEPGDAAVGITRLPV